MHRQVDTDWNKISVRANDFFYSVSFEAAMVPCESEIYWMIKKIAVSVCVISFVINSWMPFEEGGVSSLCTLTVLVVEVCYS